ncbi:MAG: hypothetical protein FWD64_04910, partial [Acidobacteriaceae bacterium]|nr:hypothetical protein [Acidobacteriaceae bacterium]
MAQQSPRYVLGLDLGSASLGWALIEIDENETPISLLKAGVRIFEPGVDGTDMEIQEGKDQSKAVNRRTARLHRRQLRRRAARQKELFLLLQTHGLLPPPEHGPEASAAQRHELLESLDREIYATFGCGPDGQSFAQKPLYFLRARALDHRLEAFELGRVLFHLSQRRGFLSNRKDVKKSEKEKEDIEGVKAQIRSLKAAIEQAGARTLGEYFAQL